MKLGTPGGVCDLDLGRVRIVFDDESRLDLWFEMNVLWALSANDIKREAHGVVSAIVREEESSSAEGPRSGTGERPGPMTGGPASHTGNAVRTVEGRKDTEEIHTAAARSDGFSGQASPCTTKSGRSDTVLWGASGRPTPVLIRQFPPVETTRSAEAEAPSRPLCDPSRRARNLPATRGQSALAGSRKVEGLPVVPGTEAVVAYRARLRMSSVVLHFRGKGLRRGAFLFLAVPEVERTGASSRTSSFRRSSSSCSCRSGSGGECGFGSGCARNSEVDADVGAATAAATTRTTTHVGGKTELWVTDESVPLMPALSSQWAASTASQAADTLAACTPPSSGQSSASSIHNCADGQASRKTPPPAAIRGTAAEQAESRGSGEDREEQSGEDDDPPAASNTPPPLGVGPGVGTGADVGTDDGIDGGGAAALLTLRIMPSGRSPLPPLCCGVCGFSWETDGFGRRFRIYHIAVANNASLVWYLHKRFSEFLALHAALSGSGGGGGGGGEGIPRDRLPEPPTRTFGMLKLFPEKMEQFRRGQLESYLQELLSIPEALANRTVLSFLGLISSSRHDLMSRYKPERSERENTPACHTPPCTLGPSSGMPDTIPATADDDATKGPLRPNACGDGTEDRRRGRENADESGPAAAAAAAVARVADRTDSDSSGDGGRARSAHAGFAAEEGSGERCRGGRSATAAAESGSRDGAEQRVFAAAAAVAEGHQRQEGNGAAAAAVAVATKVERLAALEQAAQGGDVVLFRCRGLLSRLQRWVLRSEWDHVGVVVSGGPNGRLELLESTKEGVRLYPLVERVRAYHDQGFAHRVAWRKLRCANPPEARARLQAFARQAEGKAYGIVLPFTPRGPKEGRSRRHSAPPAPPSQPRSALPAPPPMSPCVTATTATTATTTTAGDAARGDEDRGGESEGGLGEEGDAPCDDVQGGEDEMLPRATRKVEEKEDRPGQESAPAVLDTAQEDAAPPCAATNTGEQSLPPQPPPHPSYLCSQLVGAALSEMGVWRGAGGRGGKGGDAGWLWVLPGAFGQGGAVEKALVAGASLGEEVLVDAHEPEVASAVLLRDSTRPSVNDSLGN